MKFSARPVVMIINEYAGSGGDLLPYIFRFRKAGPLIGKRTWGGLVGHHGSTRLIDGGFISSPNLAFYSIEGVWGIEIVGVAPDIDMDIPATSKWYLERKRKEEFGNVQKIEGTLSIEDAINSISEDE